MSQAMLQFVEGTDGRTVTHAQQVAEEWLLPTKALVDRLAAPASVLHHTNQSVELMVGRTATHAGQAAAECLWHGKATVSLCKRRVCAQHCLPDNSQ